MAHYTRLNWSDVQQIADEYGLSKVEDFKLLSGGSSNTNYLVKAGNKQYVVTICEQKKEEEARDLVRLLEHLTLNGFATSTVVRNLKNKVVSSWESKPIMVKDYLVGQVLEDLPHHLLVLIGVQLGKLHQIEAPAYLPEVIDYGKENFQDVKLYAEHSEFHEWLMEIEAYILPYITSDLPKSFIHSDVFFSNVIISEDESSVTIMDFEEAAFYYRLFDVGMTIVGLCKEEGKINIAKAKSLLKGYEKEIQLSENEHKALKAFVVYAAAAMSFWRHRNFNYLVPTPTMSNHFMALKNVADYVKSLPATFLTT